MNVQCGMEEASIGAISSARLLPAEAFAIRPVHPERGIGPYEVFLEAVDLSPEAVTLFDEAVALSPQVVALSPQISSYAADGHDDSDAEEASGDER